MSALNKYIDNAILKDVPIRFRNFAGNAGQYNAQGQRNFCALLDPDTANAMRQDGWNIKQLKPREEGDLPQDYIKVKVNFSGPKPPKVYVVNSRGRSQFSEDMLPMLDWADFAKVDVILNPYKYSVNGNEGVTAYLQTIFCFIREDELELEYAGIPDADGPQLDSSQSALDWQDSSPEEIEFIQMRELQS